MTDINKIKDKLRHIDGEIEGIKRDMERIKRLTPIEEPKLLPVGLTLLLLGLLFIFAAIWSFLYQLNVLIVALNFILSLPLIYFGWGFASLGFKIKQMSNHAARVLRNTEKHKAELERQISAHQ